MGILCVLLSLLALSTAAPAQDCTIGVYADPNGRWPWVDRNYGDTYGDLFAFYVVMFTEDTVNAVAYRLSMQGLGTDVRVQSRIAGPAGGGLILNESDPDIGTNVALGECAIGFGTNPVVVEFYVCWNLDPNYDFFPMSIEANTNQHPTSPVYSTCNHVLKECEGLGLQYPPMAAEPLSFGKVKSLFHQ